MGNGDQLRPGVRRAVGVLTAWRESDEPTSTAALAEDEIRSIIAEGPGAQQELVIGLIAVAGFLLDDLAAAAGRPAHELLQELAARFA